MDSLLPKKPTTNGLQGFKHPPIPRGLDFDDMIVDLLHLGLRIGDKLLLNLIRNYILDPSNRKTHLIAALNKLGIPFAFWTGMTKAMALIVGQA